MSASGGDWRDEGAYDAFDGLTLGQLPFDFLRRNPDYRADYPRLAAEPAQDQPPPALARWGLRFRHRSRTPLPEDPAGLAAAVRPALGHPDLASRASVRRACARGGRIEASPLGV